MNISFQPVWDSYLAVTAVIAGLGLLLLLAPLYRPLEQQRRRVLVGLRLAAILLLALALLRPTWVSVLRQPQTSTLIILLDRSRSMQLPDASGLSRWEAQRASLERSEPVLGELAEDVEIKVYGYDHQLRQVEFDGRRLQLPDLPDGDQTDIGGSLQAALERELGKRLAGVVLMGDGAQTALDSTVDVQQPARQLAALGYPLFTVAFGTGQDATHARDVVIENLPEYYTVFVRNELAVEAQMRVRGYANQEIPVELVVEDEQGQAERIGPIRLTARSDDQRVPVRFTWMPEQPGRYRLTVRAEPQPGELVTDNNELTAFVTVLDGGLRVLYVVGQLGWESRFVRDAINFSPDMEVDVVDIDPQRRSEWPVDLSPLLDDARYDVVLLGDVDAEALGAENLTRLASMVEGGHGLMMLGGLHSFGPGGYRNTPLADVLPVVMDRFERQEFGQPPREDLHLPGPLRMLPARSHPLVQLAVGTDNERLWRQLPELNGANRFLQIKDAAGVQVVAETGAGDPLLVTGEYGQGRVVAFAGDSTWRWVMRGFDDAHRRFWRQAILWLVHREDLDQDEVWVRLPQRRVMLGQRLGFTAGARSSTGDPLPAATLAAELLMPDGERRSLSLAADGEQRRGMLDEGLDEPGAYAIEVAATVDGQAIGTARADFQVFARDLELSNPAADPAQLARLAQLTQSVGGQPVAPEQLPEVLRELQRQLPDAALEVEKRWQLGDTPGDAWLLFLGLIGLLVGEWALRKKWGLV